MTFIACATKVAVVNIVLAVAIDTAPAVISGLLQGAGVATVTMQPSMRVSEFKRGLIMIEFPYQPRIGIMTGGTVLAEFLLVYIIIAVTIDTLAGGATKNRGQVAGFATQGGMLTDERETADIMIETNLMMP